MSYVVSWIYEDSFRGSSIKRQLGIFEYCKDNGTHTTNIDTAISFLERYMVSDER